MDDDVDIDAITDALSIGSGAAVRSLGSDHQFDRVLSVGYFNRFGYGQPDASTDDLLLPDDDHEYEKFEQAVDEARDALNAGERVLVHCQAGVSRSGAVCAAVVAVEQDHGFDQALEVVRDARRKVDPTDPLLESARRYVDEKQ